MSPTSLPLAKLAGMLPEAQAARFGANVADASAALDGRAVVQKSLAEGFGLTVAEAMWKARPGATPARRAAPIAAAVAAVSGDHGGLL